MRRACRVRLVILLAALAVLPGSGLAALAAGSGAACGGAPVATAVVAGAGDTPRPALAFERAGTAGRRAPAGALLAGLELPAMAPEGSAEALARRLEGFAGAVAVVYGARVRLDRRDRVAGQVSVALPGGRALWLQGALVAEGLAVTGADAGPCTAALLALEAGARAAGRGPLAGGIFRPAEDDPPQLPGFVILEGRVETVGNAGATTYLNFGADRRTDATVRIFGRNSAGFPAHKDPGRFEGLRIRVRGWAFERDGVDMSVAEHDLIEILDKGRNDR